MGVSTVAGACASLQTTEMTMKNMQISLSTLHRALSRTSWMTPAQVTDYLRQCGPLAFADDAEHEEFNLLPKRRQYQSVYHSLFRHRHGQEIDTVLGSDDGKETRVYMYVPRANPVR